MRKNMSKYVSLSMLTLVVLSLTPVINVSAQTRLQSATGSALYQTTNPRSPAQTRTDMLMLVNEVESLMNYYLTFSIGKGVLQGAGYDSMGDFTASLDAYRRQIINMPPDVLQVISSTSVGASSVVNIADSIRSIRVNEDLRTILDRADIVETKRAEIISARMSSGFPGELANIRRTICSFNTMDVYPSDADMAIAKGVSELILTIAMALPPNLEIPIPIFGGVIKIPFVVKIITGLAWGITVLATEALNTIRENGLYCEALGFYIEGSLSTSDDLTISLVLPFEHGGYGQFVKDLVTSAYNTAVQEMSIPVANCAALYLQKANDEFEKCNWYTAALLYRTVYQAIGSATCQ